MVVYIGVKCYIYYYCENRQRVLKKKKIFSVLSILKCQHQSACEADLLRNKNIFKLCMVDWKITMDTYKYCIKLILLINKNYHTLHIKKTWMLDDVHSYNQCSIIRLKHGTLSSHTTVTDFPSV